MNDILRSLKERKKEIEVKLNWWIEKNPEEPCNLIIHNSDIKRQRRLLEELKRQINENICKLNLCTFIFILANCKQKRNWEEGQEHWEQIFRALNRQSAKFYTVKKTFLISSFFRFMPSSTKTCRYTQYEGNNKERRERKFFLGILNLQLKFFFSLLWEEKKMFSIF